MGMKPRPHAPGEDPFVVALGDKFGRQVYGEQPNLTPHGLSALAEEAWWNAGMYPCEDRGIDIDDRAVSGTFTKYLEAAYNAAKQAAGPVPTWNEPRLNELRAALASAGVDHDRLARVDAFIADADLDGGYIEGVDSFCALLEYIFGLRASYPTTWEGGQPYFEVDTTTWKTLFGDVRAWCDVERRLCTWIWQLPEEEYHLNRHIVLDLAPAPLRAHPDEDIFGVVCQLLLDMGQSEPATLSAAVEHFMYAALGEHDELTSFGRYVLDAGFDAVFPLAQRHKRVSYYGDLLLNHAIDVFCAHEAAFDEAAAGSDGWKLDLTAVMLRVDKRRFEDKIIGWAESLSSPGLCSHMAIYLCRAFGDEHRTRVLATTESALDAFGGSDSSAAQSLLGDPELAPYAAFPNSSVKLCLIVTVLRAYGESAFGAVQGYQNDNEGWMIRYYEILAHYLPGHPGACEQLVAGLMKRLPATLGGLLTYPKYVGQLVDALSRFDLAPHRDAIAARFDGEGDPTIAGPIAKLIR